MEEGIPPPNITFSQVSRLLACSADFRLTPPHYVSQFLKTHLSWYTDINVGLQKETQLIQILPLGSVSLENLRTGSFHRRDARPGPKACLQDPCDGSTPPPQKLTPPFLRMLFPGSRVPSPLASPLATPHYVLWLMRGKAWGERMSE